MTSSSLHQNSSVTLMEDGKMITEDLKIAEIFNHYFTNMTESLGISEDQTLLSPTNGINDPVEKAMKNMLIIPALKRSKNAAN